MYLLLKIIRMVYNSVREKYSLEHTHTDYIHSLHPCVCTNLDLYCCRIQNLPRIQGALQRGGPAAGRDPRRVRGARGRRRHGRVDHRAARGAAPRQRLTYPHQVLPQVPGAVWPAGRVLPRGVENKPQA